MVGVLAGTKKGAVQTHMFLLYRALYMLNWESWWPGLGKWGHKCCHLPCSPIRLFGAGVLGVVGLVGTQNMCGTCYALPHCCPCQSVKRKYGITLTAMTDSMRRVAHWPWFCSLCLESCTKTNTTHLERARDSHVVVGQLHTGSIPG
jgi:hypothetical protein